jgi:GAF domain-containing protein
VEQVAPEQNNGRRERGSSGSDVDNDAGSDVLVDVGGLENENAVDPLSTLQRMARALHLRDPNLESTLDAVTTIAADTISGAQYASVSLVDRGRFLQRTASDSAVRPLGEFQRVQSIGPCYDASTEQEVIRVDDTKIEDRWGDYAAQAVAAGVLSMLCIPLWVDTQHLGALTLYATRVFAFEHTDERLASVFASYAALALADARRAENLQTALGNRDVIGQGKGILMERHRITADAAFQMLAEASQRLNRKLYVVADELVNTGALP